VGGTRRDLEVGGNEGRPRPRCIRRELTIRGLHTEKTRVIAHRTETGNKQLEKHRQFWMRTLGDAMNDPAGRRVEEESGCGVSGVGEEGREAGVGEEGSASPPGGGGGGSVGGG
jgi:hypothetical protein